MTRATTDPPPPARPGGSPRAGEPPRSGTTTGRARWLRFAAAAVCVLLLAEGCARLVGPRLEEPRAWADRAQEVKAAQMDALTEMGCTDVVVTGNSMVRDAVMPSQLSEALGSTPAYNAALDAATPELVGPWMRDQVQPRLDPAVVIVGVASFDLNVNSPAGRAAVDAYLSSPRGRQGKLAELDRAISEHSALLRHRAQLRSPGTVASALVDPAPEPEPLPTEAGRPVIPGVLGPDGEGRSRADLNDAGPGAPSARFAESQLLADFDAGDDPATRVQELVRLIGGGSGGDPGQGPVVVVVLLPTTEAFGEMHPGGTTQQLDAEQHIIDGARSAGAPVLDLRGMTLPDGAFADTHHLNATGATALTRVLAEELVGLVGVPPRCGD